jgi:type I restriction enzyme S subunit
MLKIDRTDWREVALGDVAIESSKRISNPSESGLERFVGSDSISQWDLRISRWDNTNSVTSAMKLFEPGDYLLVRRSLYASDFRERAPLSDFSGVCSGDILTIKENKELVSEGFLISVLNSDPLWKFVVANASGSITRRIKWNELKTYRFSLPPIEQQNQIAKLMWSLEDSIKKKKGLIGKIDSLIASTLNYHFSKTLPSKLILGDTGKWVSGGTPSKSNLDFWDGAIPWVSPKDMKRDFIDNSIDKITSLAVEKGANLLANKSILVVVRGMILAHSFPVAMNTKPVAFNQDMRALEVNTDLFVPEYILFFLQHRKKSMLSMVTETTHGTKRLASEELYSVVIPKPLKHEQQTLVNQIMELKQSVIHLKDSITDSKNLLRTIINKVN